jgi:hypothetical protein
MTICAGMLCSDGIVLCADSLETVGMGHRFVEKLVKLPLISDALSAVVVCATDNGVFADALIEKISEAIDRSDGTFASARNELESATLRYCSEIWTALDSTQNKPSVEMLIGLKTVDDLRLLHMAAPVVRTIETWEFIGFGQDLGIYKAKQYGLKNIPTDTAASIIAYIVDIVKNNVQFCGGPTSLSILHSDGNIENKSQDYIAKTIQGYKSIEWLLDTWVLPFLPLIVAETGEDALSMIGKLGEPKTDWVEKIPGMLQFLKDRKKLILAGEIPAIPENQNRKLAVHGFSSAARTIQNSAKKLYVEGFLSEASNNTIQARYQKVSELAELAKAGMDSPEIDRETIRESLDRLSLLLTSFESTEQLLFEQSEDQQPLAAEESQEQET